MKINFNCKIMKKILGAILCLIFLGACTQKDGRDQTGNSENYLELSVRSGSAGMTLVTMPVNVYNFNGLSSNQVCEPDYFTAEEKISYQDLLPGKYTFFVLGNVPVKEMASLYLTGREMKDVNLRWMWDSIPELFGGIAYVDGSEETKTIEMKRLIGKVNVHVTNSSEFQTVELALQCDTYSDTIQIEDYVLRIRTDYGFGNLMVDKDISFFPTEGPLRGTIIASDESGIYYFDFVAKNRIQRNKRLELNLTLNKASSLGRSANVVNGAVTCVEKVTEL